MLPIKSKANLKIEQLESIRGLAALLVVMYHIPNWNSLTFDIPLIRGGGAMVDLFFVLSGFVIYTAYNNKLNNWSDLLKFQFLRFGRLYPVHLFFIFVYLGIETLKYILQTHFGVASHSRPPFVENNLWAFFREALLIKAFWPNETAMAVNSPSWSISAEFYTYIFFGLIVLFARRFKNWIFTSIALLGLLIMLIYQPNAHNFMLRCLTGFFIGCMTAMWVKKQQALNTELKGWMVALSIGLVSIVSITTHGAHGAGLLIYPSSALLIASILLSHENIFNKILSHSALVWLGTISYSLYMCHGAVLWFFQQGLRFILHPPEVTIGTLSVIQLDATLSILAAALYLLFSLSVGFFSYLMIEKPCRKWSRTLVHV